MKDHSAARRSRRSSRNSAAEDSGSLAQTLLDASMELAALIHTNGTALKTNEAMAKSLGLTPAQLVGKHVTEVLPPDAARVRLEKLQQVARTGKPVHFEHVRGGRMYVTTISPLFDDAGKVCQLAAFSRDITHEKQMMADIEEKNLALRHMLNVIQSEKSDMERVILRNVDQLIMPAIRRLLGRLSPADRKLVNQLEHAISHLTASFPKELRSLSDALTPTEVRICHHIRQGMMTKEIARTENISASTVSKHRENIRHKLGISGKKVNFVTYLSQLRHEPSGRLPRD